MDKHIEMLGSIRSREDFIEFMRLFTPTADMDGYYKNLGKQMPEDINWDFIATLLYAGSVYE